MSADFFPAVCNSLSALTHLCLREYGDVPIGPHIALLQRLTGLRHVHLSPSERTFSADSLVRTHRDLHRMTVLNTRTITITFTQTHTHSRTLTHANCLPTQEDLQPLAALTALESLALCNYSSVHFPPLAKAVRRMTLLRVLNLCVSHNLNRAHSSLSGATHVHIRLSTCSTSFLRRSPL